MSTSHLKLIGSVTAERLVHQLELTPDGSCGRHRWLIDTSDCSLNLNASDVIGLQRLFSTRPTQSRLGVRVAFIAPMDFNFGVARIVESLAGPTGIAVSVFREADAAEQFLAA